jgi:CDP-diacylglycerol--inositol 3-phosphatidyltransferase
MCAGNEMFFVALYLMKWISSPIGLSIPLAPALTTVTWPQAIAILSCPIFLTKNVINIVQLWKASKILVGVDLAERAQARENGLRPKES